jgi:hypothetical protein
MGQRGNHLQQKMRGTVRDCLLSYGIEEAILKTFSRIVRGKYGSIDREELLPQSNSASLMEEGDVVGNDP